MSLESQVEAIKDLKSCIAEVRSWFISNRLMTKKQNFLLSAPIIDSIVVGESSIKPSESVRNLGSWFDAQMRMDVHISKTCSKAILLGHVHSFSSSSIASHLGGRAFTYAAPVLWNSLPLTIRSSSSTSI